MTLEELDGGAQIPYGFAHGKLLLAGRSLLPQDGGGVGGMGYGYCQTGLSAPDS